jgi:hypothetical protein
VYGAGERGAYPHAPTALATVPERDHRHRSEMYLGKPYREKDEKTGEERIYFRSQDLFRYLDARKVQYKSPQHVYQLLKNHDATNGFWHVGASGINWWSLPAMESPISDKTPELKFGEQEF